MTYTQFKQQFTQVWQLGNMTQIRQWQTEYPTYYKQFVREAQ